MNGEKEMYEYSPNSDKKSEKLIFSGLLVLSAIFFIGSKMPSMPLPILFQLLSVCLLAIALIGAGSTLFCRYVYCLEKSEGEYTSSDLVIYRVRGARRVAVCRVACAAVSSMTLVTKENRRALMRACKGCRVYRYTDLLFADNLYLLRLEEDGEAVGLFLLSDPTLKELILKR